MSSKDEFIHVRVSTEEQKTVEQLAEYYGVNRSEFFRLMIAWINENRPTVRVTYGGAVR